MFGIFVFAGLISFVLFGVWHSCKQDTKQLTAKQERADKLLEPYRTSGVVEGEFIVETKPAIDIVNYNRLQLQGTIHNKNYYLWHKMCGYGSLCDDGRHPKYCQCKKYNYDLPHFHFFCSTCNYTAIMKTRDNE
jgi:hypothetical protein